MILENRLNNYISLDSVYLNFKENIDHIPMILSKEDISIKIINSVEYISKTDYIKIDKLINNKRISKEITINDTLIEFKPQNKYSKK